MKRFFSQEAALDGDNVTIEGALAHRIANVLRVRAGESIALFDGSGGEALITVHTVSAKRVAGVVTERTASPAEPRTKIRLYQSVMRGERFDWLVEKATELGVSSIIPVLAARSVVRSREGNRLDRWRRIAVEAAEQCGRGTVPVIEKPQPLTIALAEAQGLLLFPYELADAFAPSIPDALSRDIDALFAAAEVSVFIGPEGGWEPDEVADAQQAEATVVRLGDRILRSETAGIVAVTLVMQACGELG